MEKKTHLTLYFTKGAVPTDEDHAAAKKIAGKVVFRNAAFANPDLAIEKCHAVAGAVPECYKVYPMAGSEEPEAEQTPSTPETTEPPAADDTVTAAAETTVGNEETAAPPPPSAPQNTADGWPQS